MFRLTCIICCFILLCTFGCKRHDANEKFISASDESFHFVGRWNRNNKELPQASWTGFAVEFQFTGEHIRVILNDSGNFYNVKIDDKQTSIIGGRSGKNLSYLLAEHLEQGTHHIHIQRRNISFESASELVGFYADKNASVSPPHQSHSLQIQIIGDSYTAAEGNEATQSTLPWKEKYPVTNFARGYAALLAEALDAELTAICRSGSGITCTWDGKRDQTMPERYDRLLMENPSPLITEQTESPDMIMISLGINDASGLRDKDGNISGNDSQKFCNDYKNFLLKLRQLHPQAKLIIIAPHTPWVRENTQRIFQELKQQPAINLFYTQFDMFPGSYVADGHPATSIHKKIAAQILQQLISQGLAPASAKIDE